MAGSFLQDLAEAHDWCEALGHSSVQRRHCRLVSDPEHPEVWSANHASGVRATTPTEIDEALEEIETAFGHSRYRVVDTDAFTPAAVLARLALDGWQERPAVIVMALTGPMAPIETVRFEFRAVETVEDWSELRRLHDLDVSEEGRASSAHSPEVAAGLFEGTAKKARSGRIFLAGLDGQACAYALAVPAPGGFGFIDDVFTDPAYRKRGVGSGLVAHCVEHLRAEGCATAFLTALASDTPKRLYARLGFAPAMLARRWVKTVA